MRLTLIIALLVALLIGCAEDVNDQTGDAAAEIARGWAYYNGGDLESALMSFERAASLNPQSSDAFNGLGWTYLQSSDLPGLSTTHLNEAIKAFQRSTANDRTNGDAWIGLGLSLSLRRGDSSDFKSALESLDQGILSGRNLYRHDYTYGDVMAWRAMCNFYLGEYSAASSDIGKALEKEPQNSKAIIIGKFIDSVNKP